MVEEKGVGRGIWHFPLNDEEASTIQLQAALELHFGWQLTAQWAVLAAKCDNILLNRENPLVWGRWLGPKAALIYWFSLLPGEMLLNYLRENCSARSEADISLHVQLDVLPPLIRGQSKWEAAIKGDTSNEDLKYRAQHLLAVAAQKRSLIWLRREEL